MEKSRKDYIIDKILDVIIYGGLLATLVWSLLKGFGVINTPVFVQQLPVITGTIAVLGFAYKIGRYVERIEQRLAQHALQFKHIDLNLIHIDKDVEFLKQRV